MCFMVRRSGGDDTTSVQSPATQDSRKTDRLLRPSGEGLRCAPKPLKKLFSPSSSSSQALQLQQSRMGSSNAKSSRIPGPTNGPFMEPLWPLIVGIKGISEGSWGVQVDAKNSGFREGAQRDDASTEYKTTHHLLLPLLTDAFYKEHHSTAELFV